MVKGFQERTWLRITGMTSHYDQIASLLRQMGRQKHGPQAARILHVTCKASDHQLNLGGQDATTNKSTGCVICKPYLVLQRLNMFCKYHFRAQYLYSLAMEIKGERKKIFSSEPLTIKREEDLENLGNPESPSGLPLNYFRLGLRPDCLAIKVVL